MASEPHFLAGRELLQPSQHSGVERCQRINGLRQIQTFGRDGIFRSGSTWPVPGSQPPAPRPLLVRCSTVTLAAFVTGFEANDTLEAIHFTETARSSRRGLRSECDETKSRSPTDSGG